MASFKLDSRVREYFQTVNTGNISPTGAIGDARTFASFLTADGDSTWYQAKKIGQSEEGVLTRVSAGVYSRTVFRNSINTTSPINFDPGDGEIFCDIPAKVLDALNLVEADVASAATCDIGTPQGAKVRVTGTVAITSFGTIPNKLRFVRFADTLTLTHNATSLVLIGQKDIVTAANDRAIFKSDSSGNWHCLAYDRFDAHPQTTGQATIASATTTDLGAVLAQNISVTGTVTITSFGSSAPTGALKTVAFSGVLILTHNATSLVLPGAANITTAAGDTAEFRHEGSGNWRCLVYQRGASLTPIFADSAQSLTATQKAQALTNMAQATLNKSADYTAALTDRGALILLTGSHTLAFTAVATLGDGWWCAVKNTSTGTWVLDPNSSETIDGSTTISLLPGEGGIIWCDGSALHVVKPYGLVPFSRAAVLTDAQALQARANIAINAASLSRSSNTILVPADHGAMVNATGTFTQTLTAAATLGDKWRVFYRNNSTGVITLDPNGSETVNGKTTWNIYPGEGVEVICDGANFFTIGDAARVLLSTGTASNSASLDFTRFDSNRFSSYELIVDELVPASGSPTALMRVSTDGGSSFISSSSYSYGRDGSGANTNFAVTSEADSSFVLTGTMTTTAGKGVACRVQASQSANMFGITWSSQYINVTPNNVAVSGGGSIAATVNAVRFLMSSGNIASGTIRMYGIR